MGFVNSNVKSDTAFPSGGIGKSGYGRECGTEGIRSFANIKTHYVNWCIIKYIEIILNE